jgi:hypothetical protein
MRMILKVSIPMEPFNTYVRDGSAGKRVARILEDIRPEAAYFWEEEGLRGGILVVDLPEASKIPALAEPWFLSFNATVQIRPTMTPEDLAKAGLEALGTKYAK